MEELVYRYPGPYPFDEAQAALFFGRDREAQELFYMIAAERLVVLFAKSGIGKTSLLQAGVTPKLRQANIQPINIRFNDTSKTPLQIFKENFCEKTNQKFDNEQITLWELLKKTTLEKDGKAQTPLLILDQFEELFTLNFDIKARAEFFNALAYLVSGEMPDDVFEHLAQSGKLNDEEMRDYEKPPLLKIVIALRSDMLHYLDEISMPIPSILRNRYQLLALKNDAAREAIEKPAAAEGTNFKIAERFGFTPNAMQDMMQVLSKDNEVESFQLQLVCRGIEESILKGKRSKYDAFHLAPTDEDGLKQLNADFFGGKEGLESFIENFYREVLLKLNENAEVGQQVIENQLLTDSGRRRSVDKETLLKGGATEQILAHFEQERLLRKEPRMETYYYELSHDTLVEPILKVKKERLEREEKLRLEQERIAAEAKAKEEEAKRKAAERQKLEAEQLRNEAEYQKEQANIAREEAERLRNEAEYQREEANIAKEHALRQRRNARLLAMGAVVGLCLALVAAGFAWWQTGVAREAVKLANERNIVFLEEKMKNNDLLINEYKKKNDVYKKSNDNDLIEGNNIMIKTLQLEIDTLFQQVKQLKK